MRAIEIEDNKSLISKIDWNFPDSKRSESIHSIHPYPAKFIPEIPRGLLNNLDIPEGTSVLDPFCGSGVTLYESQQLGLNSYGVDLNPIACLISKIKTSPLPVNLVDVGKKIISHAKNKSNIIIPEIPNLDHWFKKDIQSALSALIPEIKKEKDIVIREFLMYSISAIIVRVSNQDSDTRYAAVTKNICGDDVYKLFLQTIEKVVKFKALEISKEASSLIINKSIFEITKQDIDSPVGLVITSPPYPNAYEYWLYHKYRMFWLGFDPLHVKENEIGARAHYFKKNRPSVEDFKNQLFLIFQLLSSLVVKNGFVTFVTGRSKIHGEIIRNDSLIIEAAKLNNFGLFEILTREMNSSRKSFNLSHARIKEEYIIILKRL